MALKQLMLSKKIEQRKSALADLLQQEEPLKTRAAQLETALEEAATDEEIAAVDEEITKLDTDQAAFDEQKSALEGEIAELEGELEEITLITLGFILTICMVIYLIMTFTTTSNTINYCIPQKKSISR